MEMTFLRDRRRKDCDGEPVGSENAAHNITSYKSVAGELYSVLCQYASWGGDKNTSENVFCSRTYLAEDG